MYGGGAKKLMKPVSVQKLLAISQLLLLKPFGSETQSQRKIVLLPVQKRGHPLPA